MTLEDRVKNCIIERLNLSVKAEEIPDDSPIFGDGLGLDSIDALELVVALQKEFGVQITDDDMSIFRSVMTIADFIRAKTVATA